MHPVKVNYGNSFSLGTLEYQPSCWCVTLCGLYLEELSSLETFYLPLWRRTEKQEWIPSNLLPKWSEILAMAGPPDQALGPLHLLFSLFFLRDTIS